MSKCHSRYEGVRWKDQIFVLSPGDSCLRGSFGVASISAPFGHGISRVTGYKKFAAIRGDMRSLVTLQRTILTIIWQVLKTGHPYNYLGGYCYIVVALGPPSAKFYHNYKPQISTLCSQAPGESWAPSFYVSCLSVQSPRVKPDLCILI